MDNAIHRHASRWAGLGASLAAALMLAACSGGSGGGSRVDGERGDGGGFTPSPRVEGPLDALQDPLSEQIIQPLGDATAGTPVEAVLVCVDRIVVQDGLDIVDALAVAVQNHQGGDPAALVQATADGVASGLARTVGSLTGLLDALDGDLDACRHGAPPADGENPLAGTPLEPVGAALAPVLAQIMAILDQGDGIGGPPGLDVLAGLTDQLRDAVAAAFAQLPPEATEAPVIGPALTLIQQLLVDVGITLDLALGLDIEGTLGAVVMTVQNVLEHLLNGVVPIGNLEDLAGNPGDLSGAVTDGINALLDALTGLLAGASGDGLPLPLIGGLLDPIQGGIIANLLDVLHGLLGGGSGGDLLGNLNLLDGLLGNIGGGSSPLQPVLVIIFDLVGGVGGGGGGGGGGGVICLPILCNLLP